MKLPNAERAVVPSRKITHYPLSRGHRDGQHKAGFFELFGFSSANWEVLTQALRSHAIANEVTSVVETPFGKNYVIDGAMETPVGRTPLVRSVWFIANGQDFATLATAYPLN